jgi:hypothetical protein
MPTKVSMRGLPAVISLSRLPHDAAALKERAAISEYLLADVRDDLPIGLFWYCLADSGC